MLTLDEVKERLKKDYNIYSREAHKAAKIVYELLTKQND